MSESYTKIVNFDMCKTCKNKNKSDKETPCNECIATPARPDSRWPMYYEEDK